jgi:hypothetical protein
MPPAFAYAPPAQPLQVEPLYLNFPTGHTEHAEDAMAPVAAVMLPAGHAMQEVAAAALANLPWGQAAQLLSPTSAANVPGEQSAQPVALVAAACWP